jgi:hypothetical protein
MAYAAQGGSELYPGTRVLVCCPAFSRESLNLPSTKIV